MLVNHPLAMSHQVKTVEYGLKHPYFICAIDPGGGKSFCLLALHEKFNCKTLIVVPNYLLLKWYGEIQKWFGNTKKITLIQKKEQIYGLWDTDICLIGYSNLKYAEVLFEWADQVGVDEAQFLKEMTSQRSATAHEFIYTNSIKKLMLLTGTPIVNRVAEYYSLIALCNYNPKLNGKSAFLDKFPDSITFADHFSHRKSYTIEVNGKFVKIVKWIGVKNKEELKSWLDGIYIRFTDKHWMKEDPLFVNVPVSSKSIPELEEAYEEFCINESGVSPTIKMEAAIMTVPYTIKFIEGLLAEGITKIVAFSDHVEPATKIAEHFGCKAVTGKINDTKKFQLTQQFQNNPDVPLISGTIGSMSTGHDLFASHIAIFNDEAWVPGLNKQAWKRIHRIGASKRSLVYKMMGSPQHERISESLYQKMLDIEEVT